ncbi:MAG: hypothetical protein AAB268_09475 [Elusimicrobiota bacterium]
MLSLLAALLVCATPAAALRMAAVPTQGACCAVVPAAVVPVSAVSGGQGIAATSFPSLVPSLSLAVSPSNVVPSLAAHAAILSASKRTPAIIPAALTSDVPASIKIAGKSFSLTPAGETDALTPVSGDELFDGAARIPTVAAALTRGAERGVSMSEIAHAIAGSKKLSEAGGRLIDLGLLDPSDVNSHQPDMLTQLNTLIEGLWRETSPALELEQGIDRNWSVPALIVRQGQTAFYIHPIAHGRVNPDNRGPVRRLIKEIKASGGLLYSEQDLPHIYGYRDGREFLDHAVANEEPVSVRDADAAIGPMRILQAIDRALYGLIPLGVLAWSAFQAPSHPWAWCLFGAASVAIWLFARAYKPLLRWRRLLKAAQMSAKGDVDGAAWYAADAAAFYGRLIDPAALRRLRLPLPLGLGSDWYSQRSLGMADALAPDAASRGAKQVHVLAGYEHALEIAWRLENPKGSRA